MSVTYGFYNSNNSDRIYTAEQVSAMFDGFVGDGVHQSIGGQLLVKAVSGMQIKVQTGRAWFNHTWTLNDAEISMTVPSASAALRRIDAVVLQVNSSVAVRENKIYYKTGTAASNPQRPPLINTAFVHEYALAYIAVEAGATSITQSKITNMVGTSETPFVAGLAQVMSIDDIIAQWQAQWTEWMDSKDGAFDEFIREYEAEMTIWKESQQAEFDDWFANLHYVLDGDVAGHLQNEIDEIKELYPIYYANYTLYANNWTDDLTYSLENDYPSTRYDILNVYPIVGVTTEEEMDQLMSVNLYGYNEQNVLVGHDGDIPTIDIPVKLQMIKKGVTS